MECIVSVYYCLLTLSSFKAVGAPFHKDRELDDSLMHKSTIIVDSYEGAMVESGDIILSKVNILCSLVFWRRILEKKLEWFGDI